MNTPSFQPDEKSAFELANYAVEMLTVSALGFAVLELQEQLSQGRPHDEPLPDDVLQEWRANTQRTLSELRLQMLHADESHESKNSTVISEAYIKFSYGLRDLMRSAIEGAISQAALVAAVEHHQIAAEIS